MVDLWGDRARLEGRAICLFPITTIYHMCQEVVVENIVDWVWDCGSTYTDKRDKRDYEGMGLGDAVERPDEVGVGKG